MATKICSACTKEKDESEFYDLPKWCRGDNEKYTKCKTCVDYKWKYDKSVKGRYNYLKCRVKRKELSFMGYEKYKVWFNKQELICHYCKIPEELLIALGWHHPSREVSTLTTDQKIAGKGYIEGNIFLACLHCNETKNEFFSVEETEKIAEEFIEPKWRKRWQLLENK